MKTIYSFLFAGLILSFQANSQTAIPPADSPQYKLMKANGTLLQNAVPVDTRTEAQKDADLQARLKEIKKTSPNFYISGKEKRITFGSDYTNRSDGGHSTRGQTIGNPVGNPAGCGSYVPCGSGGGTVSSVTPCDDCSSAQLPIGFTFCFYGINETNVYVNNNGNLSFSGPFFNYVPVPFPTNGYDMIAPFWADVQTGTCTGGNYGDVCYESTATHFIVTWTAVGYFPCQNNFLR